MDIFVFPWFSIKSTIWEAWTTFILIGELITLTRKILESNYLLQVQFVSAVPEPADTPFPRGHEVHEDAVLSGAVHVSAGQGRQPDVWFRYDPPAHGSAKI